MNVLRFCPAILASLILIIIIISSLASPPLAAQDTTENLPSNVSKGKDAVEIPRTKSDAQISNRLAKILNVTRWYENLKVSADEGVVTLEGVAHEASHRDWAQSLAKETDGVVAVINKIELSELGWFDLSPASKELKSFWKASVQFIPYLVASVLLMMVSLALYRVSSKAIRRLWAYRTQNPILIDVLSSITAVPIILVGMYLVLRLLGLTGLAFTLLGGTGAAGLVAGFAFKNILENYFSGIMLSVRKPFVIGDIIEVAGQSGVVFNMTTRGTTLVDFDGNHVLLPNSTVYANIIKNRSINPVTRTKLSFEVPSITDATHLQANVKDFLASRPEITKEPETEVGVSNGKLEISVWVDSRKTNVEKLKSLLSAKISQGITSGEQIDPRADGSDTTKNDVMEVLKKAEAHQDSADVGRSLLNERRT